MTTLLRPLTAPRGQAAPRRSPLDWLLARDQQGASIRVLLVLLYLGLVWLVAVLVERPPIDLGPLAEQNDLLSILLRPFLFLGFAAVQPAVFRHLVLPLIVLWLGVRAGAHYVDDLFELHDFNAAQDFVLAGLFGMAYPTLEIKDGEVTEASKKTTLFRIGGPGFIKVYLGNAALFERVGGRSRIYGPPRQRRPAVSAALHLPYPEARHFVHGFDRLREVVDLRDQVRQPPDMDVYTKDGLAVKAKDIQVIFRLASGSGQPSGANEPAAPTLRSVENPYPYSEQAVRRLIFGKDRQARPWQDAIARTAAGAVLRQIGARRLQDIIAQKEKVGLSRVVETKALDTGQAMSAAPVKPEEAENKHRAFALSVYEAQQQFNNLGVEVIWIGAGTLETPNEVSQEWINAWSADRAAHQKLTQMSLEAKRNQGRSAQIAEVIHHVANWWLRGHVFTEHSAEAKDVLRMYHIKLTEIHRNTPGVQWPEKTDEAIQYIQQLTRPLIIGGEY